MPQPSENNTLRFRWSVALGIGLGLAVLAATITWSAVRLRQQIRLQIASRDGETLEAVAAMQYLDDKSSDETVESLEEPGEQMQLVLKISRLRNVMGIRLFSPEGKFVNAVPAYITESSLAANDLETLRALKPVSHFDPQAHLEEHDLLAGMNSSPVPLLQVNIPLRADDEARLAGVAQFLMNGASIAQEYVELDRHLALQSVAALAVGGSVLVAGLGLAFRRVQRANRLLAERTCNLLQANRELALAARTSAIGALTSHLIHGLKNPLTGLESFVQDQAVGQGNGQNGDWHLAVATTERMKTLINRVVRVLQEEATTPNYEISLAELIRMLTEKLEPTASRAGVQFGTRVNLECALSGREANLILLILENLAQNAIEATPAGKRVRLYAFREAGRLVFEIQDEGPGLPAQARQQLFTPCASTKKGGSGIGLAISRQLAKHIAADLELKHASPMGCIFKLALPRPERADSELHAGPVKE
jgi:signal transduction histidine kinase